jgi:hypothetical protein
MAARPGPGCGAGVEAGDGQAADLRAGGGVQQGEQAGQPLVRVGGRAGPPAQQRPLGAGVQHCSGEPGLGSQAQRPGRVDEDELALPGPGEVAAQHVGVLAAAARPAGEEVFQVGGGDLGPAGDPPGGGQVAGEVAEDPQAALEGDVAELAAACAAGAVVLGELAVVERGDRAGEPGRGGVQVALPPGGGAAAGLIPGQDQSLAGEERRQSAAGRIVSPVRSGGGGQDLPGPGGGAGGDHPAGVTQDRDRAAGMVTGSGVLGQCLPPGRDRRQPGRQGSTVTERPVRVGELAAVAHPVAGVAALLPALAAGDDLRWPGRPGGAVAHRADARGAQVPHPAAAGAGRLSAARAAFR